MEKKKGADANLFEQRHKLKFNQFTLFHNYVLMPKLLRLLRVRDSKSKKISPKFRTYSTTKITISLLFVIVR